MSVLLLCWHFYVNQNVFSSSSFISKETLISSAFTLPKYLLFCMIYRYKTDYTSNEQCWNLVAYSWKKCQILLSNRCLIYGGTQAQANRESTHHLEAARSAACDWKGDWRIIFGLFTTSVQKWCGPLLTSHSLKQVTNNGLIMSVFLVHRRTARF